jgi:hypothetical protein
METLVVLVELAQTELAQLADKQVLVVRQEILEPLET